MLYADTINLHWLNEDGSIYQNSTCVIDSDLILPSTPPTKYGYTFTGWKISNYRPIEYLESTGTQYIDTGVYAESVYLRVSGKLQYNNFYSTGEDFLLFFGTYNDRCSMTLYTNTSSGNYANAGIEIGTTYGTRISAGKLYTNTNYEFDLEAKNGKLNGYFGATQYSNINYSGSLDNTQSIRLFSSIHSNKGVYAFVSGKIYWFKIYNNNILVRDFIPVLDNNNVPCLFDRVEFKFYYNQGTGQFIAGPVL